MKQVEKKKSLPWYLSVHLSECFAYAPCHPSFLPSFLTSAYPVVIPDRVSPPLNLQPLINFPLSLLRVLLFNLPSPPNLMRVGAQMGLLAALVALLFLYTPGTSSSSFSSLFGEALFSNYSRISCESWNCVQCVELRGAVVLDTWRTGRRFSVTEDCWWSSAAVLATSSMDTKPTAVCQDAGPGTPRSVLVRCFITIFSLCTFLYFSFQFSYRYI